MFLCNIVKIFEYWKIDIWRHSQNTWRCFCQLFTPSCVTASSTPHHKICDSEPIPPPSPNILTEHKCNMQQQIQNVIYKSTLFQCLIKPRPKQFPTQVLAGSLNKRQCRIPWRCQEEHQYILIENIDLSSKTKGHIFASTRSCFVFLAGINFPLYASPSRGTSCDTPPPPCDNPYPTNVTYFVNGLQSI